MTIDVFVEPFISRHFPANPTHFHVASPKLEFPDSSSKRQRKHIISSVSSLHFFFFCPTHSSVEGPFGTEPTIGARFEMALNLEQENVDGFVTYTKFRYWRGRTRLSHFSPHDWCWCIVDAVGCCCRVNGRTPKRIHSSALRVLSGDQLPANFPREPFSSLEEDLGKRKKCVTKLSYSEGNGLVVGGLRVDQVWTRPSFWQRPSLGKIKFELDQV